MKLLSKFFLAGLLLTMTSVSWATCPEGTKNNYKGECVPESSTSSTSSSSVYGVKYCLGTNILDGKPIYWKTLSTCENYNNDIIASLESESITQISEEDYSQAQTCMNAGLSPICDLESTTVAANVQKLLKTKQCPQCDLSGADLYRADLSGADLSGADLSNASLRSANLTDADLIGADLTSADLRAADLTGTVLIGVTGISLALVDGYTIWPQGFNVAANVKKLLNSNSCTDCDLTNAVLTKAKLQGANLYYSNLAGAILNRADLTKAYLAGVDFSGANLTEANLDSAYLIDANLNGTNLSGAFLKGANLEGADLTGVISDASTIWPEGFQKPTEVASVSQSSSASTPSTPTTSYTATASVGSTDSSSSIAVTGSGNLASKPTQTADTSLELEFWQSVKDSDDAEMLQAYLDQYPNGVFVSLAKIKLKKLGETNKPTNNSNSTVTSILEEPQCDSAFACGDTPEDGCTAAGCAVVNGGSPAEWKCVNGQCVRRDSSVECTSNRHCGLNQRCIYQRCRDKGYVSGPLCGAGETWAGGTCWCPDGSRPPCGTSGTSKGDTCADGYRNNYKGECVTASSDQEKEIDSKPSAAKVWCATRHAASYVRKSQCDSYPGGKAFSTKSAATAEHNRLKGGTSTTASTSSSTTASSSSSPLAADVVSCKSSYGGISTVTRRQCNSTGGTVVKVISRAGSSSSSSSSSTASTDLSRYSGRYMIKNTICIGSCAAVLPLRLKISGGQVKGEFKILNNSHGWIIHYRINATNSIVGRKIDLTLRLVEFGTDWPKSVRLTVEFSSDGKTVKGIFDGTPITGTYAGTY